MCSVDIEHSIVLPYCGWGTVLLNMVAVSCVCVCKQALTMGPSPIASHIITDTPNCMFHFSIHPNNIPCMHAKAHVGSGYYCSIVYTVLLPYMCAKYIHSGCKKQAEHTALYTPETHVFLISAPCSLWNHSLHTTCVPTLASQLPHHMCPSLCRPSVW